MDGRDADRERTNRRDRREANRARASRRERPLRPTSPDPFRNLYLHNDTRILPYPPEEPAWSFFDDLRAALDAPPVPRERIAPEPVAPSPPIAPIDDSWSDHRDVEILDSHIDVEPVTNGLHSPSRNIGRPADFYDQEPTPVRSSPVHSLVESPQQPEPTTSAAEAGTPTVPSSSPQNRTLGIAMVASIDRQPLARCLVDQLLQDHGCTEHVAESNAAGSSSLSTIYGWNCPDVLSSTRIAQYGTDWNTLFPVEDREKVFTGCNARSSSHESTPSPSPTPLDLNSDTTTDVQGFQIHFDVDSAGGFASSLAVAREGIRWKAGRAQVSNLRSSLHLDWISVYWNDGRSRTARRPLHQVPHLPFGRLAGFAEVEIYLIFPYLYHPSRNHWVITADEFTIWTDRIFLPALREVYPPSTLQHLPASAQHITLNSTAAQIESRVGAERTAPYHQDLHFALQGDRLAVLWENIQARFTHQGLTQFRGCQILLTAKNLKLSTQRTTWSSACDAFFQQWHRGVDAAFLTQDFYDIAKEVVPPTREATSSPLTLSWRRCCLESFSTWLARSAACAELPPDSSSEYASDSGDISGNESEDGSENHSGESSREDSPVERDVHEAGDADADAAANPTDPDLPPTPSPQWKQEFYPQSMVRDQGSITITPNRTSALFRRGMRHLQKYSPSKEVFAVGDHYLFGNRYFDSLALDPGMLRSMQHVGGAISHSPLALLRGYLHNKLRSHVALQACRERSYSIREEYRVTGVVLVAMDTIFRDRGLADRPITLSAEPWPFWIHPTAVMLDWWRWNINKLCVGFEMTWSLQPRTVVHWEHTRVMMMFLKCLLYVYGGQGGHPRRSLGLWIDRRTKPGQGTNTERIQEGMSIGSTLQQFGYGWLANKLNWASMVFLPSCRNHMVFNTPSLQSAYHKRYWAVAQTRGDFVLFHDGFHRMLEDRFHPRRSALLLRLLVDLCLRSFRQEVFQTLAARKVTQPLQDEAIEQARAGEVPLTVHGFHSVFQGGLFSEDLYFVQKTHLHVTHVEGLFVWLWGWDGDGDHGDWVRQHWEYKPYRVLFRQCFEMVAQIHGMRQAREWRQRLRETWIRTHWILPYPDQSTFWSRSRDRKLRVWSSVHPVLLQFGQRQSTDNTITPDQVDFLPTSGWQCAPPELALRVELPPIPTDLDRYLATVTNDPSPLEATIPLPASGMLPSPISDFIGQHTPEQRYLRSFQARTGLEEGQVHSDKRWQRMLKDHIKALIHMHQEEVKGRQRPKPRADRVHRSRAVQGGLAQLNVTLAQLEDENSDSGTVRARCHAHSSRLNRMQRRLRAVEKRDRLIQEQDQVLQEIQGRAERHWRRNPSRINWDVWIPEARKIANQARQTKLRCRQELKQLSKASTQVHYLA